eukprot:06573_4
MKLFRKYQMWTISISLFPAEMRIPCPQCSPLKQSPPHSTQARTKKSITFVIYCALVSAVEQTSISLASSQPWRKEARPWKMSWRFDKGEIHLQRIPSKNSTSL